MYGIVIPTYISHIVFYNVSKILTHVSKILTHVSKKPKYFLQHFPFIKLPLTTHFFYQFLHSSSLSMASMSSLKMISSLNLSTTPLQTQNQVVSSSISPSFPSRRNFNTSTTKQVSTTKRSSKNTRTNALFFNNQKQHQESSKLGLYMLLSLRSLC